MNLVLSFSLSLSLSLSLPLSCVLCSALHFRGNRRGATCYAFGFSGFARVCLCTYLSPACPSTHTFHWFLLPSACLLGLLASTWQEPATKTPKLGESVVEVKGLHKHVSGLLACLLACLLVCLLTCVLLRNTWLPAPALCIGHRR